MTQDRKATDNKGFAIAGVPCFADTFVVNQTLVLRINICGENRHLRQARKRYSQWYDDSNNTYY
jgi:hypothetical protein